MGLITYLQIILSVIFNAIESSSIITHFQHHNFPRYIDPSVSDWEIGLREATYHALLRERNIRHPHLREYLYNAPLLGRQDTATPFGDIAIVARGQLYSAPGGFQFIQDPYQNDCEGCHNTPLQCDRTPCEYWAPKDHERLLALWSIKRIRHRDPHCGFRYEFEYKVSPMSSVRGKPFITRNGHFDYSIEGHKFVVQKNPSTIGFQNSNFYPTKTFYSVPSHDSNQWSPHYREPNRNAYLPPILPPITEEYYDEDPRNRPYGPNDYKNGLYQPPESPPMTTTATTLNEPTTATPKDNDLYNNAIGTLTSKFTTRQIPSTTVKSTQEAEFLFPKQEHSRYTEAPFLPTNPNYHKTQPPSTPHIKFPTTVPKPPTTPVTSFSESTRYVQYSEPDPLYITTTTKTPTASVPPFTTTKQYTSTKTTTRQNDYTSQLFEGNLNTKKPTQMGFYPQHDYMGLGEQAITVVTPPNMLIFNKTDSSLDNHKTTTTQNTTIPTTSTKQTTITTVSTKLPIYTHQEIMSTTPTTQPTEVTNRHIFTTPTVTTTYETNQPTTYHTQKTTTVIAKNPATTTTENEVRTKPTTSTFHYITYKSSDTTLKNKPSPTTPFAITHSQEKTTVITQTTTMTPELPFTTIAGPLYITKHSDKNDKDLDDSHFEDEIFGKPNTRPTIVYSKHPKGTLPSDSDDIFGTTYDYFESYDYDNPPTQPVLPKIIFSNFYSASTSYTTNESRETTEQSTTERTTTESPSMLEYNNVVQNKTTIPITSQSYITSVSFEINKKNNTESKEAEENIEHQTTNMRKQYMNQEITTISTTNESLHTVESSKVLDRLTTSVLSNAKSINYLSNKNFSNPFKYNQKKDIKPIKLPKQNNYLEAKKGNTSYGGITSKSDEQ